MSEKKRKFERRWVGCGFIGIERVHMAKLSHNLKGGTYDAVIS